MESRINSVILFRTSRQVNGYRTTAEEANSRRDGSSFGQSEPYKRSAERPNTLSKKSCFRQRYAANQGIYRYSSSLKLTYTLAKNIYAQFFTIPNI